MLELSIKSLFKKFLLLLIFVFWAGEGMAFVPNGGVVREERTVEVSVLDNEATIRIRSILKNNSSRGISVKSWLPAGKGSVDMKLYLDLEGLEFHKFEDRARLDVLADAVESWSDVRFFRMGDEMWADLYRSYDFEIPGDTTRELVWEYRQPIVSQGDFQGVEVFLDDGLKDDLFQVEFSLGSSDVIKHFWAPLLAESVLDRSEYGMVAIAQHRDFLPNTNLRVLWSGSDDPMAKFYSAGHEYIGHFVQLSAPRDFSNVTLLLDGTGSMADVWSHVQELLRFLLDNQLDKRIRVLLAGDGSSEWLVGNGDTFVENTSQVRQKILEAVAWRSPLGKVDLNNSLGMVSLPMDDHLIIVFSDEAEVDVLENSAPVAVLRFYPDEGGVAWSKIATATRGLVQRAYRSVMGTEEAEELLNSVNSLRGPISSESLILSEDEKDMVPSSLIPQFDAVSPLFVGRRSAEISLNQGWSFFDWLPREWAMLRLAELLEKGELAHEFSTGDLDAVLAIGRTFGVESEIFTESTSRNELIDALTTTDDVWTAVRELWKTSANLWGDNLRIVNGIPLWRGDDEVWRQYDFDDRVDKDRLVEISPFSAAQRQLFVLFPEVFASAFGAGVNVDFCSNFRCFNVMLGKRSDALPSDRAFLRDFDPNHWAVPYVIDLVDAGILMPEANGKLHLDRAITRGEFVKMLVVDRYGEGFERASEVRDFNDLSRGDEGYDAVQVLVQKNVIKGFPDGSFRPMQDLTRAEAVKILLAEEGFSPFEISDVETPVFADSVGWERGWVEEAVRRGIVRGYGDGSFRPGVSLTRAEAAKVIVEGR